MPAEVQDRDDLDLTAHRRFDPKLHSLPHQLPMTDAGQWTEAKLAPRYQLPRSTQAIAMSGRRLRRRRYPHSFGCFRPQKQASNGHPLIADNRTLGNPLPDQPYSSKNICTSR